MARRVIWLLALLIASCELWAQEIDFNEQMKRYGLVDVQSLDKNISVELKYATEDNFVGENMYGSLRKAYLLPYFAKKSSSGTADIAPA